MVLRPAAALLVLLGAVALLPSPAGAATEAKAPDCYALLTTEGRVVRTPDRSKFELLSATGVPCKRAARVAGRVIRVFDGAQGRRRVGDFRCVSTQLDGGPAVRVVCRASQPKRRVVYRTTRAG
jgi:hypothetical protein